MIVTIPLVFGRGLNDRQHWATRAKHVKTERGMVVNAFSFYRMREGKVPPGPYEVTLTRLYSGREREMDDDNWVGAAKAIRDQVAAELKVNDGNRAQVRFHYEQEKSAQSLIRIEILTRESTPQSLPVAPQDNRVVLHKTGSVDD